MSFSFDKTKMANYFMYAAIALLLIGKILYFSPILYFAVVVAAVGMCVGDNNFRVGFCMMLVPNIKILDSTNISFLINILITVPVFAYVVETRRVNVTALSHVLLLAGWELLHIFALNNYSNLLANMDAIIILYYVECMLIHSDIRLSFPDITRKFSFGCIMSAGIYSIMVFGSGRDPLAFIRQWRLYGFAGDPNYFALYISVAICMMLIINEQHKKRDYVYLFLLITLQLFTASKMALVILIIMLVFFIAKSLFNFFTYKGKFIRRIVLLGAGLVIIFSQQIAQLIDSTLERLIEHNGTNVDIDTITSNRFKIQTFYLSEMVTDPILLFFGYGLQYNSSPKYEEFAYVAHNTFMDLILAWGIVGIIMFYLIIYRILNAMRKNRREKLTVTHFFPLIITFFTFIALSCLDASMFWWIIFAALLPLRGLQENENSAYISNSTRIQHRRLSFKLRKVAD